MQLSLTWYDYHLHGSGIQRIYARFCERLDRSMKKQMATLRPRKEKMDSDLGEKYLLFLVIKRQISFP